MNYENIRKLIKNACVKKRIGSLLCEEIYGCICEFILRIIEIFRGKKIKIKVNINGDDICKSISKNNTIIL